MQFLEKAEEWNLIFHQGVLTLLKIDFRLTIVLADESVTIELCIETPFTITNKGADSICIPEDTKSLAPILSLINSKVDLIEVRSCGHLILYLGSDVTIKVGPDPSYEAWQLGSSSGFLMICPPEGKVVTFQNQANLPNNSL